MVKTGSPRAYEEIDNFVKQGNEASAVKAIMRDLSDVHQRISDDADKHMGSVLSWWHQWGSIIDRVKNAIRSIGVPDSIDKQVGDQYERFAAAQRNLKQQQSMGAFGNVTSAQQALDVEKKKLDVLRQQQTVVNTQQRAQEAAAKAGVNRPGNRGGWLV
ncbi:hypothetical protein GWC77_27870 [Paraburkholderia sp. NMBU_R16]|uniref:hypothetical protein n=1 Tax=Paraburkholderia sp. NMBU_R16 TaxID=2698676 RepID=UPI0015663147|nr:hypothetical protein [Paraburkholderia sp. NMBU_R16]NRO99665.1 hypothetical protein [Paraburkholderia sp. NMBU_R16]